MKRKNSPPILFKPALPRLPQIQRILQIIPPVRLRDLRLVRFGAQNPKLCHTPNARTPPVVASHLIEVKFAGLSMLEEIVARWTCFLRRGRLVSPHWNAGMGIMVACSNEVRFLLCSPKLERKDPRAMKSYTSWSGVCTCMAP